MRPSYVYVASSWRNPMQPAICATLRAADIDHYDFRNPESGTGFSWREVKPGPTCHVCGQLVAPPDAFGRLIHRDTGSPMCEPGAEKIKAKGTDWELVETYLQMVNHPRAIEGYASDYAAMERADTFVMVLPCGKSAHLELGWAVGAGKRTAILLEDPVEPELMYRMVDHLAPSLFDLLGWMGVE